VTRALPHLLARLRRAMHLHFLRSRRAQLQQGIDSLQQCITHDQLLIAHMRSELAVVDSRFASATEPAPLFRSPL